MRWTTRRHTTSLGSAQLSGCAKQTQDVSASRNLGIQPVPPNRFLLFRSGTTSEKQHFLMMLFDVLPILSLSYFPYRIPKIHPHSMPGWTGESNITPGPRCTAEGQGFDNPLLPGGNVAEMLKRIKNLAVQDHHHDGAETKPQRWQLKPRDTKRSAVEQNQSNA